MRERSSGNGTSLTSTPSTVRLPDCTSASRTKADTMDDFPAPLRPTMPTRSPPCTSKLVVQCVVVDGKWPMIGCSVRGWSVCSVDVVTALEEEVPAD